MEGKDDDATDDEEEDKDSGEEGSEENDYMSFNIYKQSVKESVPTPNEWTQDESLV